MLHYAYSGVGFTRENFYSFQLTTEDGGLYQFDKLGIEKAAYIFDFSASASAKFGGQNGKLYVTASKPAENDDKIYKNHLFIFDEKTLKLLDTELLDDNKEKVYGLTSSAVVDHSIYLPFPGTRDRNTYEQVPNNTFLAYPLEKKEKNITLYQKIMRTWCM